MKQLFIIILLLVGNAALSQCYITASGGYFLPTGGSQLKSELYDSVSIKQNAKISNFSYTAGVGVNISAGNMLSKNFGIECTVTAIIGRKFTSTIDYIDLWQGVAKVNKQIGNFTAPLTILFAPSLVFKGNAFKRLTPYGRMGLAILAYGKQHDDYTLTSSTSRSPLIYSETVTTNYFSMGFSGAIGVNIPIHKKIKLGVECSVLNLNPYAKKSILTKHMRDGYDNLSSIPVSKKETDYVKQFTSTPSFNQDVPDTQLSYRSSYSNAGLMVNLCYSFAK